MEEKKPAASPDPAEQVEELLAQARQTAAGRVSRREMDAILESVRSQDAPEPSGAKQVRQGKTAPDEQDLIPEPEPEELSLPEQRRQTARQFFRAMFLTLILLGGVFGALLVEESYRRVGMGSLPTQVFSARLTEEGIAFTVGEAAPDPEQTARLAWLADRLEPFLLPRGLRITVRALLGGRLLLDWLWPLPPLPYKKRKAEYAFRFFVYIQGQRNS